ncbi:MAG: bifunctional phosphoglucose/phosphomannose isomerase [Fimbriimonadaceae bacterium]|nr:bifunctional phosphoglucose/phosphomannose isomerase [Fimbriimonadaceae bacterium]
MHSLDDRSFVERLDPKGMLRLTEAFPDQCRRALSIASAADLRSPATPIQNVVLAGLGGSAAGGDFTKALFDAEGKVPFQVVRDYGLPGFVGPNTLVICSSYSGNTEETLASFADAHARGAHIVAVTSGGKLAEACRAHGYSVVQIPGGQPPRTALGFMLVPSIVVCERLGLLPKHDFEAAIQYLEATRALFGMDNLFDENEAKQTAALLQGAVSVLYGLGGWQAAVANRWKGQINENAKNMTFANAFPELNHNEILGWVKANEQGVGRWVALVLNDGEESAKMRTRARVTEGLIGDLATVRYFEAGGRNLLEKILNLVYAGDFVSLYLAALNGVDPENIDSINILKAELASVG